MASDNPCVFYNDAASVTGGTINVPVIVAGSNVPQYSNSPYVLANFGQNGLQGRVVSAGLRIRYIGTELNRGGEIVGLQHPSHSGLNGYTVPLMNAYKETARLPVIRPWTTLLYRPVETTDLNFNIGLAPAGQQFFMGFIINSATSVASPASYENEFFSNLELQGAAVQNKKPSHVDVVGHGAVNAITNMSDTLHSPHQLDSGSVAKAIVHASSQYISSHVSQPSKPTLPTPSGQGSGWFSDVLNIGEKLFTGVLSLL